MGKIPIPKLSCSCFFLLAQQKLVGHLGQDSMLKQPEHYKSTCDFIASCHQRRVSSFELVSHSMDKDVPGMHSEAK